MKGQRALFALLILAIAIALVPATADARFVRIQGAASRGEDEGIFAGVFDISQFAVQGNQIVAHGWLSVSTAVKGTVVTRSTPFTAPVSIVRGGCDGVELEIGPFNLLPLTTVVPATTASPPPASTPPSAPQPAGSGGQPGGAPAAQPTPAPAGPLFAEMTLSPTIDRAKFTINQSMVPSTPEGSTQFKDAMCALANTANMAQTVSHLNTLLRVF